MSPQLSARQQSALVDSARSQLSQARAIFASNPKLAADAREIFGEGDTVLNALAFGVDMLAKPTNSAPRKPAFMPSPPSSRPSRPTAAAPKPAQYAASHLATYTALKKSSPAKARAYLAENAPAIQSAARRASV